MIKIISFPHLGDYYVPIKYFIKKITKCHVLVPPLITRRTIDLGSKYAPEFICVPFKYNLGNFIEALEQGADVLLQAGGGCRYGYYAELQEQILRDLDYNFEFVNFIKDNHVSIRNIYKFAKKNNKRLTIFGYFYYLIITLIMIIVMDKLDSYFRENVGFEVKKDSFKNLKREFLNKLKGKIGLVRLIILYYKYKNKYKKIEKDKPDKYLKIAILGELYSIMEPYANNNLEMKLANKKVYIKRFTNLTYLILTKKLVLRKLLRKGRKYLKYHLGADATTNVILTYLLAKEGYDGIIHIKSFGCTPEISAMPIMDKISSEYNIPILHLSFDASDNETGLDTRLEAFYDMIVARRENKN